MTDHSSTPLEDNTGIVVYCDGSARPNPGNIGYGYHGYKFKIEEPKKGTGNHLNLLSASGYVPVAKKEGVKAITPLAYYDGFGCTQMISSNNVAELLAAKNATDLALESRATKILLKTDSEYVIKGIKEWSPQWVRNRWFKQDGSPVPNQHQWKALLANINTLTTKGATFDIKWVKGHSDVFGNIMADKLAVIGCMNSKMGHSKDQVITSQPEGYWKEKNDRHPLLCHRSLFFNSLSRTNTPGTYYLGNHSKDDEFIGKKTPEGSYSVVHLETPEVPIELIRKYQSEMSGDFDSVVMVHLDTLYGRGHAKDLEDYGVACLVHLKHNRLDLGFIDKDIVTRELRPQKLAPRAMDALAFLKELLREYKQVHVDKLPPTPKHPLVEGAPEFTVTDITSAFFVEEEKLSKSKKTSEKVTKMVDTIVVGVKTVSVTAALEGKELTVKLILGTDTPERNALKKIEATAPTIELLLWKESDTMVRYATVIRSAKDYGIWCGFYSNLVVLPK